ncbi:separin [Hemiscyllium ocellatum]|uniref:separin n=1 Tax=Hemiscyllium ocellatum TaxID=170820 RepID=UPI002966D3E5|nr:separin [Hemiscyllium ocellatum]
MLGPAAQVLGRTATRRGCEELREQLQAAVRSVPDPPADHPELRVACDRVIRACIQRLGDPGSAAEGEGECRGHLTSLLGLAVLACEGLRASSAPGGRCAPLYLERLVFHLLRCACSRGLAPSCAPLCGLLLAGLSGSPLPEAGTVARSAYALLWGAAPSLPRGPSLSLRLQALRLLALDPSSALLAQRFAQSCRLHLQGEGSEGPSLSGETLSLLRDLLKPPPLEDGHHHRPQQQQLALCCQLALQAASSLSKAGFHTQTRELLQGASALFRGQGKGEDGPFLSALQLAQLSAGLRAPSPNPGRTLSRALGTLRSAGDSPGPPGRQALAAGCRFLLSELRLQAERAGGRGGGGGGEEKARSPGLRELFQLSTFLHVYLELEVSSSPDAGTLKLCYQNLDLFTREVYEFLMDPEEEDSAGAEKLLPPSKLIVEKMVEVEEGLVSLGQTDYIGATGLRLYNLAYGFYSRKLFGEAVEMAVTLRGDGHPPDLFSRSTLPLDRVARFYRLLVQCYRKLGELDKAMETVCMWLLAQGDPSSGRETEPIALWACLKADAVKSGDEELQLRTLKDALQPWGVPSPRLAELLQEELRAYKGLQTDTSRERFNVICDLLQLCSPPGPEPGTEPPTLRLRAMQLLELAQLLCYRDFTQHTECSAMDCVEEALTILGSLKETPENWEQLLDDRANAYLWRYVCDLESRIRESVERCRRLGSIPEPGLDPEDGDPNDMEYEEKQQGALSVHDHIDFNLTAESKRCESLDEALSLWKRLLLSGSPATLRNPEQTAHALHLTAALYRLMDKPFQVIESYNLLLRLLEPMEDTLPIANVLLQLGETLLAVSCLGPVQVDVTVCLLTLTSLYPRGDREELLQLTRLRKGRVPVTVGIPASVSTVLSEFDSILAEQREISNETELKAWWDGRTSLDRRMRELVESLERDVLGCWKGLLLTAPPDPQLDVEAAAVCDLLGGPRDSDQELLKAMLGASSVLSDSDVQSLADRLGGAKGQKVLPRLQAAVHALRCLPTDPPRTCSSQLVLILDKHLQRLPWESIPTLRAHRVSRLPSFQFLLAYVAASTLQLRSVLTEGLNPSSVYYVLNPQGNLPNTEKTFKDWFRRRPGWEGVVGRGPSEGKLKSVLCNRDLYLYAGHGAGVRFLEGQEVQKLSCRAASLLLGCSSAALALRGDLEGVGILLKYMMAGCPLFLGNLWDVTDKDIDRYMDRLLRGWLEAGSQTSLLQYVAHARTAPKLKYLIGASPVVYGLSVSLQ